MRRLLYTAAAVLLLSPFLAAYVGSSIGTGILHPARTSLTRSRVEAVNQMLARTGATSEDFTVRASDGADLRGWKIRPALPNGEWVLLFHGVADNRTGVSGPAEFLLRHSYSVVMMDSRAQGESGGDMATYGWKERFDAVTVTDALYAGEKVRHLYALGISMGAAIALQSAAVGPRIEGVVAEDPFANLREVCYDYAGLHMSPLLGKTLFRPAVVFAMHSVEREGGFKPEDVSPQKAVSSRSFPVLLICGTRDFNVPCRHAQRIYEAARGPKELWVVRGAEHASALGLVPVEYERRVVKFLESISGKQ